VNIKQIAREPEVNKIVKQRTKFRAGDQWQGDGREPGGESAGLAHLGLIKRDQA
jgi:hypothetical protein